MVLFTVVVSSTPSAPSRRRLLPDNSPVSENVSRSMSRFVQLAII